jgi:quercetin dioxygenase-like cupin family protein
MKHYHYTDIENQDVPEPANKVKVRWLINEKQNAPNFAMRRFEIAPGGNTPYHTHDWEHEVYILSGNAIIKNKDGETNLKLGDVILVEPNEEHNFVNNGEDNFVFLCMIPLQSN